MLKTAKIPGTRKNFLMAVQRLDARKASIRFSRKRFASISQHCHHPTEKSFRLAVIINLAVNLQPCLLFVRREMVQYLHQVADHFLANRPYEGRDFRRDAYHHLAASVALG